MLCRSNRPSKGKRKFDMLWIVLIEYRSFIYRIDNFAIFRNKVEIKSGVNDINIKYDPFEIEVYSAGHKTITVNAKGLMRFEHRQQKPIPPP